MFFLSKSRSTGNLSLGGRRKSSLTSLLSLKSNPLTSKHFGKQKSVSPQTLETPSKDVRKISLQNETLLNSSETVEPRKELDNISHELENDADKCSVVNYNVPSRVEREKILQIHDTGLITQNLRARLEERFGSTAIHTADQKL